MQEVRNDYMNWESEDFRKKQPEPELGSWPFWIVPEKFAVDYVLKLAIFMIGLPMLFGAVLTPLGLFFNFALVDFIIYKQYEKIRLM